MQMSFLNKEVKLNINFIKSQKNIKNSIIKNPKNPSNKFKIFLIFVKINEPLNLDHFDIFFQINSLIFY